MAEKKLDWQERLGKVEKKTTDKRYLIKLCIEIFKQMKGILVLIGLSAFSLLGCSESAIQREKIAQPNGNIY